jgi:hypothetical protein
VWKHRLRSRLARHTAYVGWLWLLPRWQQAAVRYDTELVIEGFPRSGNTFAELAFRSAQPGPVRLAHHTHAPGQVLWAVAHGIPTLLLIRKPIDAVVSYVLRDPYVPPQRALADWIDFYRTLQSIRLRLTLATFEQVTSDFAQVVARLNAFYNVSFALPTTTVEATRRIFEEIEALHLAHRRSGVTDEMQVARPSPERAGPLAELRSLLMQAPFRQLLEEADSLYEDYLKDESQSARPFRRATGPDPSVSV